MDIHPSPIGLGTGQIKGFHCPEPTLFNFLVWLFSPAFRTLTMLVYQTNASRQSLARFVGLQKIWAPLLENERQSQKIAVLLI